MRPVLLHKKKYELIRELNNLRTVIASLDDMEVLSKLSGEMLTGIAGLFSITVMEAEDLYINVIARNIGEMQVSIDINDTWSIHLGGYTAVLGKRALSILERFLVKARRATSRLASSHIKYNSRLDTNIITPASSQFRADSGIINELAIYMEEWGSQTMSSSVKHKLIINTTFKLMDGLRYIFISLQDKLIAIKANIKLLSPSDYIKFSGFAIIDLFKIRPNIILFNNILVSSSINTWARILVDFVTASPEVNSYYDPVVLHYLYPLTLGEMSVNLKKEGLAAVDINISTYLFSKVELGYLTNAYNNISLDRLGEYTLNYLSKH